MIKINQATTPRCLAFALLGLGLISQNSLAEAVPVTLSPLAAQQQTLRYSAPAEVVTLNRSQIAAETQGRISHLYTKVGERVDAGAVLAELDCATQNLRARSAASAYQRAQAQRDFAQAQWQRAQNLKKKRSISDELLEQREAERIGTRADLQMRAQELALTKLEQQRCQITAPFAALISQRLSSVGSYVNPGSPVLELVQLDQREVSAELRAEQADSLRTASHIHFTFAKQSYALSLRALPALFDAQSRTREARLVFSPEETGQAPIGAAGRLHWQTQQQRLPASLLVRRDGQLGVFVSQQQRAVFVPLPQAQEGQAAEIDLPADTLLVIEGRQRLRNGDTLLPSNAQ